MAVITKAMQQHHRLVANLIPADVLKSLDQAELLDRVVYAADLSRKAASTADPTLRKGYSTLAKAMLAAQPRAHTERQAAALIAKASGTPNSRQADAIRRQAQELLTERHPIAPRREDGAAVALAKAKAGDANVTVVYNAKGEVVGVVDPADVQAVADPADPSADIAKARLGKARRPGASPGRR